MELSPQVRLLRPLSLGGVAHLWIAEHRTLGVPIVVKMLAPKVAASATARQRLRREARVTARLGGPHIVQALGGNGGDLSGESAPFLTMELLRGEDLSTRILRRSRLSIGQTTTVVEHIARALELAHAAGVVHRDVKPANVFLVETPDGFVAKLIDFGIAKDGMDGAHPLTLHDAVMGTPPFMSPEQILGARDVDARCDVWSLAVVAYECLTGELPFDGNTFGAVCVAVHAGQFTPPSRCRPELPAAVDAFFATAFAREIERRYQTPRALADAFRAATRAVASAEVVADVRVDPETHECPEDDAFWTAPTLLVLDDLDALSVRPAMAEDDSARSAPAQPTSGIRLCQPRMRAEETRERARRGRT